MVDLNGAYTFEEYPLLACFHLLNLLFMSILHTSTTKLGHWSGTDTAKMICRIFLSSFWAWNFAGLHRAWVISSSKV